MHRLRSQPPRPALSSLPRAAAEYGRRSASGAQSTLRSSASWSSAARGSAPRVPQESAPSAAGEPAFRARRGARGLVGAVPPALRHRGRGPGSTGADARVCGAGALGAACAVGHLVLVRTYMLQYNTTQRQARRPGRQRRLSVAALSTNLSCRLATVHRCGGSLWRRHGPERSPAPHEHTLNRTCSVIFSTRMTHPYSVRPPEHTRHHAALRRPPAPPGAHRPPHAGARAPCLGRRGPGRLVGAAAVRDARAPRGRHRAALRRGRGRGPGPGHGRGRRPRP